MLENDSAFNVHEGPMFIAVGQDLKTHENYMKLHTVFAIIVD